MPVLFEYHNEVWIDNPQLLKNYLTNIWKEQYVQLTNESQEENPADEAIGNKKNFQPFLSFDGNIIKAKNYVGFIQIDDLHVEIYPKVFKLQNAAPKLILQHLFFWFDYCRKWKFPFTKSNLGNIEDVELPELIIYLMASKMLETVSLSPISLYQPVEESLYSPKGRINFSRYLSSGFINGNQHILDCDHEPFVFDNKLNRVIKYTSRLLLNKTKFSENQNILQELIFILDEVTDQPCNYHDLNTVVLNPLFTEYIDVMDICRIVLQQLLYANQQYDLSQWSLLFPMEYIFEDFIAGFLENKFSAEWIVEYQKSNINLTTEPPAFQMQHDILLTLRKDKTKQIIVDTKYKLRGRDFKEDKKKGISQTDLYQMLSYAVRRECKNVLILYPNIDEELNQFDSFTIQSGFLGEDISIIAAEVPFWTNKNLAELSTKLYNILSELLKNYY